VTLLVGTGFSFFDSFGAVWSVVIWDGVSGVDMGWWGRGDDCMDWRTDCRRIAD
jgi:hypothetical protein